MPVINAFFIKVFELVSSRHVSRQTFGKPSNAERPTSNSQLKRARRGGRSVPLTINLLPAELPSIVREHHAERRSIPRCLFALARASRPVATGRMSLPHRSPALQRTRRLQWPQD